ncbi:hypothetical protein FOCG_06285, partial [Fusarium oxysporum f. sp. radicis-lycopersici 26381]
MKLSAVTLLTLATGILAAPVAEANYDVSYSSYEAPKAPKPHYEKPKPKPHHEKPKHEYPAPHHEKPKPKPHPKKPEYPAPHH